MITHYDLFAGIGGFSLAVDTIFNDQEIKHIFCEWEAFPTAVLRKHWPEGEFYGDIADLITHTSSDRFKWGRKSTEIKEGYQEKSRLPSELERGFKRPHFTIVTGGFPCQPFSSAGRRKGTADDRYQWPNMFSVIRNVKPDWVIAENVRGLLNWNDGMVLETICIDLESEGYEVQPIIIPAVAVGAPHRRDRIWFIGYKPANTRSARLEEARASVTTTGRGRSSDGRAYPDWNRSWQEVALATCNDSVDDGLSRIVDGVPYSRAKWRKESLKAYGNAIVPQVAMKILEAIKEANQKD